MTLRYKGKLHHIGVGCPYAGWRVIMLVAGLDVQVLGLDGSPLRHLTLDPSSTTSGCPERRDLADALRCLDTCLRCLATSQSAPLGIRTRNLRIKSPRQGSPWSQPKSVTCEYIRCRSRDSVDFHPVPPK